MSLLEERITKILEMRLLGKDNNSIAESLGIGTSEIHDYEESTKSAIQRAISEGAFELEEISKQVKLPPLVVYSFVQYYGIKLPIKYSPKKGKRIPKAERIQAIRQSLASGADSVQAISEIVGLSEYTVRTYASEADINLPVREPTKRQTLAKRIEAIRKAKVDLEEKGVSPYVDAIAKQIGLPAATVYQYAHLAAIQLPKKRISKQQRQAIEIGGAEAQQKKQLVQQLVNLLEARVTYLLDRESWAAQKAFEYLRSLKRIRPRSYERYDALVELFRKYEEAEKSGTLILPKKLGEGLGFPSIMVASILHKVGLGYFQKSGVYYYAIAGKRRVKKRREIIHKAISEGVNSLEELCRRSALKPNSFYEFCRRHHIELPSDLIPHRYKPEMDAIIDEGATLEAIGAAGGYTGKARRQNAYLYIKYSGQYEAWIKKRDKIKQARKIEAQQKRQIVGDLVAILQARINQLTPTLRWPERMTFYYAQLLGFHKRIHYKRLIRMFSRYETATNRRKSLSLEELGKASRLYATYVGEVLRRVGLKPFYANKGSGIRYPKETQEAIRRVSRTNMSSIDISYFLGLPKHYAVRYGKRKELKFNRHSYIARVGLTNVSYRLAGQIYEAQAAGFRRVRDIAELLDTTPEVVKHAIEHKNRIAPKIVRALQIIYADPFYNKPYKRAT